METNELPVYAGRKVLIVDDQYVNIVVLKKRVEKYQIEAETAENGKAAIQLATQNEYDIIFMDLHMPGMDGLEVTKELRKMGIEIPIIGLSADVTPASMERGKESGMNDYMVKPFSKEQLEEVLHTCLAGSSNP